MNEQTVDQPDQTHSDESTVELSQDSAEACLLDPDSSAVAMDYYILQDSSYNNRFNIFVALQGAMLVFASLESPLLIDRASSVVAGMSMETLIRLFGLITSSIWLYTQSKQTIIITHMRDALPKFYPSLSNVVFKNAKRDVFPFSNFFVLNLVPLLFVAIWLFAVANSTGLMSEISFDDQTSPPKDVVITEESLPQLRDEELLSEPKNDAENPNNTERVGSEINETQ